MNAIRKRTLLRPDERAGLAANPLILQDNPAAGRGPEGPPGVGGGSTGALVSTPPHANTPTPTPATTPTPSPEKSQKIPTPKRLAPPPGPVTDQNPFMAMVYRYHSDWVGLARDVLGMTLDPWQEEFLRRICAGERRISIRAGHGVGKSTGMAIALIAHALTRYPQKSVCTAPTSSQLFDALMAETKFWINKLPGYARVLFETTVDKITLKAAPEASFISARTASVERPEALSGVHSEHVLLVVDEAPGVPEAIFENAVGSMSGETACTVLIGNPTRNSGMFFKTHHELRRPEGVPIGGEGWFCMHVSCLDSPRVSKDFVQQIKDTYGEESNQYRVRVLGEFPLRDDDALISADLVDAAMGRDIAAMPSDVLVFGVDVARFGDDRSCLVKRRGNVVESFQTWRGLDLMQLVGQVVAAAREDRPAEILIDSIGLGAGVADRLRELKATIPEMRRCDIRDVNVSESNAMNPGANKLRDELWIACRDWLRTRACKLPKSDDLRQELVSPTYKFTSNGKLVVESKDSMKKRGIKSPDVADALCLTFASTASQVSGRSPSWSAGVPLKRNIKGIV
jgi:phage terminase large subunit